jgi:predicted alpha/beta hydrolase
MGGDDGYSAQPPRRQSHVMVLAPPRVQHITTDDGVALALHRLGPADGIPVILATGTFSNSSFWLGTRGTGFARFLAAAGYEACVLDYRGHGASQRPAPGQRWVFDDFGRHDLATAVRTLRGEGRRPLLVGHSAGGAAILSALAAEPDLRSATPGAIIIATPLPWLQRWRRTAAWTLRFAARHLDAFPARLLRLGPEDELPGVMEQWMDWNIRGHWTGRDGTDYCEKLPGLTLPLLFIAGAGDHRFAPPDAVKGLQRLTPASHFMLAGRETGFARDYGHVDIVVSREAKGEIWPRLLEWLGGVRGD